MEIVIGDKALMQTEDPQIKQMTVSMYRTGRV